MKKIRSQIFGFVFSLLLGCSVNAAQPTKTAKTSETNRVMQFENEELSVWKTTIQPNDPLKMHRHDVKRIVVALTDTDLKVINENGEKSSYHWPKGTAHLLEADKPNELHADLNESGAPMEVMVIQFKK